MLVDDRSTDGTGRIIARLAAQHPGRVLGLTVESLPDGWLGKNHALWLGARRAAGEWLLFTDADIVFEPTTVRRAVAHAEAHGLDHLTLLPGIVAHGYWLRAFVSFILYAFMSTQQPHLAEDPRSTVGVGLGAFNLIRREGYEAIGTHAALSLRPDDDMRLGQRAKRAGLRQAMLSGTDLLRVAWYPSLRAAIAGQEKNQFANLDYSLPRLLGRVAALGLLTVAPYAVVWVTSGPTRRLLLAALGVHTLNHYVICRREGEDVRPYVPALPFTALLCGYAVLRSGYLALRHGGIRWRGTFYPLAQLRGQTGLE